MVSHKRSQTVKSSSSSIFNKVERKTIIKKRKLKRDSSPDFIDPFDETERFIDQWLRWIKELGEYEGSGVFFRMTLSALDFLRTEYDEVGRLEEFNSLSEQDKEGLVRMKIKSILRKIIKDGKRFNGSLAIFRSIVLSSEKVDEFINLLEKGKYLHPYEGIGNYWSWKKEKAIPYFKPLSSNGYEIIIEAKVKIDDIWWNQTILKNMEPERRDENEIFLYGGERKKVPILVSNIEVKDRNTGEAMKNINYIDNPLKIVAD